MRIDGFEWDENNVFKNVINHETYPDEIEEVFYHRHKLRKTHTKRFLLYGVTDSGRYLFLVFMVKKKDGMALARVISARDMTKMERSYYLKK